jgi:hypothetical protein
MNIRYSISEKWASPQIIKVIEALEFSIKYYKIQDDKSTLYAKLITGKDEPLDATADRIKNKRYELRLNHHLLQDDEPELLKSIFHEMTHVKQFIVDGLRYNSKSGYWQGKTYPTKTADDYWFSPWEMEARAMETPLWHLFEEQN